MEKMPSEISGGSSVMNTLDTVKRNTLRGAVENMWLIVTFLALAVIVTVMTTDISMDSMADVSAIGQEFFVLLFCNYIVYLTWGSHGGRQGMQTSSYRDACRRYSTVRNNIVSENLQTRLAEFCERTVEEELKSVRINLLCASGLDYESYAPFIGKTEQELMESDIKLSEAQVKAVLAANKVKPVKFTPEMLMHRERRSYSRALLGVDPGTLRMLRNAWKFVSSAVVIYLVTITAFDVSASFDWSVVGEVLFKLVTVIYGGFCGYQSNYENISIRAAKHINTQADYLEQFYNSVKNT